jgi:hypothetical protein
MINDLGWALSREILGNVLRIGGAFAGTLIRIQFEPYGI